MHAHATKQRVFSLQKQHCPENFSHKAPIQKWGTGVRKLSCISKNKGLGIFASGMENVISPWFARGGGENNKRGE